MILSNIFFLKNPAKGTSKFNVQIVLSVAMTEGQC